MNMQANIIFGYWVGRIVEPTIDWLADKRARFMRPRNLVLTLILIAAFASALVGAQDAGNGQAAAPAAKSSYDVGMQQLVPRVSEAVDQALQKLANGNLKEMGNIIAGFFLVALMVWTAVKTMAAGRGFGELIGEWVPIWVSFAFVYTFLDQSAAKGIEAFMTSVGTALGGGQMGTLSAALETVANPVFSAIATVTQMPTSDISSAFDPTSWLPAAMSLIGTMLAKGLTILFLVIAAVGGMATVIMSFVSLTLVLALAPVMVPFFMFKPLSWIFDSWLKFLLGACMMKIVLAFLLTAASSILSSLSQVQAQMVAEMAAAQSSEKMTADLLMHAMMMIISLLSTLMLMQVPSIATGLLSGSAGSTGFGGIKGLTTAPSGRIASSSVSAPTGAAAGGIKNLASGGVSSAVGARHAKNGQERDMAYRVGASKAGYDRGYQKTFKQKAAADKKAASDIAV
ncbi:type IV secretion system protein [Hydrogenophaga sp. BPS33]|uniref:type IV secretion system protein n=1 Tax=Hydrogenophaga sp. BPS33 TaxID=2651974 RepID=UPI00135753EF|nr:type IV secretion system protein [Hydrogenophaga sp. BPS33]